MQVIHGLNINARNDFLSPRVISAWVYHGWFGGYDNNLTCVAVVALVFAFRQFNIFY